MQRQTAGELAKKASQDNTKYLAREVGEAICDSTYENLVKCVRHYNTVYDEDEYCVIMQKATDPLIKGLIRRKYYAWMYLPKPRPDQAVLLYNKRKDQFVKRLWVLPDARLMSYLASTNVIVPKEYETMQAWSVAFYKGTFWEYIRHEHNISMLSEYEYFNLHRDELLKAGCKLPTADSAEAFDFGKISIEKVVDSQEAIIDKNSFCGLGQT